MENWNNFPANTDNIHYWIKVTRLVFIISTFWYPTHTQCTGSPYNTANVNEINILIKLLKKEIKIQVGWIDKQPKTAHLSVRAPKGQTLGCGGWRNFCFDGKRNPCFSLRTTNQGFVFVCWQRHWVIGFSCRRRTPWIHATFAANYGNNNRPVGLVVTVLPSWCICRWVLAVLNILQENIFIFHFFSFCFPLYYSVQCMITDWYSTIKFFFFIHGHYMHHYQEYTSISPTIFLYIHPPSQFSLICMLM